MVSKVVEQHLFSLGPLFFFAEFSAPQWQMKGFFFGFIGRKKMSLGFLKFKIRSIYFDDLFILFILSKNNYMSKYFIIFDKILYYLSFVAL